MEHPQEEVSVAQGPNAPIANSADNSELISVAELLPSNLFLLPVAQTTLFPGMMVPLIIPEGKLTKTIEQVMEKQNGYIGVVLSHLTEDGVLAQGPTTSMTGLPVEGSASSGVEVKAPSVGHYYRFGVAARVVKRINLPDNQMSVLLSGIQRFEISKLVAEEPYLVAAAKYFYEELDHGDEMEALLRSVLSQFKILSKDNPLISEEVKVALVNIDGPGKLSDFIASVLIRDIRDYQELLAMPNVKDRLHRLLLLLKKEQDVQNVQKKIQDEINQKISSNQREYYLQEQLKGIQKELGRFQDDRARVVQKFKDRIAQKKLSELAKTRLEEEMEKLAHLPEQSSEYSVCLNYLDWATSLPWGVRSDDSRDLNFARGVLEKDHFGLKDVKARILEFLAVKKLKQKGGGSILCLVGPPGTGKTSLGKSIARALNRKFFRFSVGGMRDEAEIKGHRRTYVGAMPGKMIQGLKRSGTQNPVFLIDEIDKMGSSWSTGGDPSSALLELLDPEQNGEFLDHYLDIPFDCSEVLFITTANSTDSIPTPLLDRMEVIHLAGYTDTEKLQIAKRYLLPRQMERSGLKSDQLKMNDKVLTYVIQKYARESGVRSLEKYVGKLCRKVAYKVAMGYKGGLELKDTTKAGKWLGATPFEPEDYSKPLKPGVSVGLAWTQFGGDVLQVESSQVEGRGQLLITGTLGKVMQESATIAFTYVRHFVKPLKLSRSHFDKHSFHIHVPAGAIPKDGPSAGVTIASSLYSMISHQKLPTGIAMTGELTLTGKILPVGGIKEKLLAAKRSKIHTVFLPKGNARDLKDIDPEVRKGIKIVQVATMDNLLKKLFSQKKGK